MILLQIETTLAGGMNITTFAVTSVPVQYLSPRMLPYTSTRSFGSRRWKKMIEGQEHIQHGDVSSMESSVESGTEKGRKNGQL